MRRAKGPLLGVTLGTVSKGVSNRTRFAFYDEGDVAVVGRVRNPVRNAGLEKHGGVWISNDRVAPSVDYVATAQWDRYAGGRGKLFVGAFATLSAANDFTHSEERRTKDREDLHPQTVYDRSAMRKNVIARLPHDQL